MTISCAIITISDTRTAKTDESGQILQERMEKDGHNVFGRYFAVDEVGILAALASFLETILTDFADAFLGFSLCISNRFSPNIL